MDDQEAQPLTPAMIQRRAANNLDDARTAVMTPIARDQSNIQESHAKHTKELPAAPGLVLIQDATRVAIKVLPGGFTGLPSVTEYRMSKAAAFVGTIGEAVAGGAILADIINTHQLHADPKLAVAYGLGRFAWAVAGSYATGNEIRRGRKEYKGKEPVGVELTDENKFVQGVAKGASLIAENLLPTAAFGRIVEDPNLAPKHNVSSGTELGGLAFAGQGAAAGNELMAAAGLVLYGIGKGRSRYLEYVASHSDPNIVAARANEKQRKAEERRARKVAAELPRESQQLLEREDSARRLGELATQAAAEQKRREEDAEALERYNRWNYALAAGPITSSPDVDISKIGNVVDPEMQAKESEMVARKAEEEKARTDAIKDKAKGVLLTHTTGVPFSLTDTEQEGVKAIGIVDRFTGWVKNLVKPRDEHQSLPTSEQAELPTDEELPESTRLEPAPLVAAEEPATPVAPVDHGEGFKPTKATWLVGLDEIEEPDDTPPVWVRSDEVPAEDKPVEETKDSPAPVESEAATVLNDEGDRSLSPEQKAKWIERNSSLLTESERRTLAESNDLLPADIEARIMAERAKGDVHPETPEGESQFVPYPWDGPDNGPFQQFIHNQDLVSRDDFDRYLDARENDDTVPRDIWKRFQESEKGIPNRPEDATPSQETSALPEVQKEDEVPEWLKPRKSGWNDANVGEPVDNTSQKPEEVDTSGWTQDELAEGAKLAGIFGMLPTLDQVQVSMANNAAHPWNEHDGYFALSDMLPRAGGAEMDEASELGRRLGHIPTGDEWIEFKNAQEKAGGNNG